MHLYRSIIKRPFAHAPFETTVLLASQPPPESTAKVNEGKRVSRRRQWACWKLVVRLWAGKMLWNGLNMCANMELSNFFPNGISPKGSSCLLVNFQRALDGLRQLYSKLLMSPEVPSLHGFQNPIPFPDGVGHPPLEGWFIIYHLTCCQPHTA